MKYKREIEFLEKVEEQNNPQNERTKLNTDELSKLKQIHPNLPVEYLDYLKEIGSGNFRECQFKVHGHLFDLEDLGLEEHYDLENGIKFFGDNFSGDFSGFDFSKNNGLIVEFWHEDGTIYETEKTFKEYIREQMLMDENDNDTRVKTK